MLYLDDDDDDDIRTILISYLNTNNEPEIYIYTSTIICTYKL